MAERLVHGVEIIELETATRTIGGASSTIIGVIGTAPLADAEAFPLHQPVRVDSPRKAALLVSKSGKNIGSLPRALQAIFAQIPAQVVVIRVLEGATETDTITQCVGGINTVGQYEGVQAFLAANSTLGISPHLLCAPGFTHQPAVSADKSSVPLANPLATALAVIAERLRAIAIIDGPSTKDEAALTQAKLYDSARLYMVDPWVFVSHDGQVERSPASAFIAGMIARSDHAHGFWYSPSNRTFQGIVGVDRPVDFSLNEPNTRANLLNTEGIATIIHHNGYRLWGNRSLAKDPKWKFLSVRRTADHIHDALLKAHFWAVDRAITKTYLHELVESVNAYLRQLIGRGAILGGRCWIDPDLNSASAIAEGKVVFDFDFTPTFPAEQIAFRSKMVHDYVKEIV